MTPSDRPKDQLSLSVSAPRVPVAMEGSDANCDGFRARCIEDGCDDGQHVGRCPLAPKMDRVLAGYHADYLKGHGGTNG